MAQIIGIGDPVNPALASFFDATIDFSPYGLTDRFEVKASSVTAADQSGVQRVSEVRPIDTARSLVQATPANQPQYLAGGGPNGLTDALVFNRERPDGMTLGDLPAGTMTKVLIIRPSIKTLPTGSSPNMHLLGTANTGAGRNAWLLRVASGALQMWAWVGSGTAQTDGAVAQINTGIPADTWMAVAMTINAPARTVKAGVRVAGASTWTWATEDWPDGFGPSVVAHTLGARSGMATTDGFEGRIAGALTFVGHDAQANAGLLDQINAWAFGSNSIFGL